MINGVTRISTVIQERELAINHHSFPATAVAMEPALFFASYPILIHLTEQQFMTDRVKGLANTAPTMKKNDCTELCGKSYKQTVVQLLWGEYCNALYALCAFKYFVILCMQTTILASPSF